MSTSPTSQPTTHKSLSQFHTLLIPDILSIILHYLPPVDLFFSAPHVHPTWYHLINHTKSLQDIIYHRLPNAHWPSQPCLNPILIRAFPMFFQSLAWVDIFSFCDLEKPLEENEGIRPIKPEELCDPTTAFRNMPVIIGLNKPLNSLRVLEERLVRYGFCQRRAQLNLNPPSANKGEDGLTMGTLLDLCLGWCVSNPKQKSFLIRWRTDIFACSEVDRKVWGDLGRNCDWGDDEKSMMGRIWESITSLISWKTETKTTKQLMAVRGMSGGNSSLKIPDVSPYLDYFLTYPYGGEDGFVEVVLFGTERTSYWMTDIVDENAVVPEEWNGLEGKFGNLHEEIFGTAQEDGVSWIAHSLRFFKGTRKWRG